MLPRYAVVNFVPFLMIGFILIEIIESRHFSHSFYEQRFQENSIIVHVVLPTTDRTFHRTVTTVMSDTTAIKFPSIPEEPLDWGSWLSDDVKNVALSTIYKCRNAQHNVEEVSSWRCI